MSRRGKRLLAPGLALILFVLVLAFSAGTETAAAESSKGSRVVVELTLDPQTWKVTANPDPVVLYSAKKNYADWKVASGSPDFEFTIAVEDQNDPKKRKPGKKLPNPACSGSGKAKHCDSIVATSAHKGDHKYSVTVKGPNGPVTTDPEVTIDP